MTDLFKIEIYKTPSLRMPYIEWEECMDKATWQEHQSPKKEKK